MMMMMMMVVIMVVMMMMVMMMMMMMMMRRPVFCATLRSRNAHGHVTSGIVCGNLRGKCRTHIPRPVFCARLRIEMHMDMSQEAFCAEIYKENARRFRYHLDWPPALNCYRKNPSVWPRCLGNHSLSTSPACHGTLCLRDCNQLLN